MKKRSNTPLLKPWKDPNVPHRNGFAVFFCWLKTILGTSLMFTIVSTVFMLGYHQCPRALMGAAAFVVFTFVSCAIYLYSKQWKLTKHVLLLAVLGFAVLSGGVVGTSIHLTELVDYWPYYQKRHYTNVAPDEPAAAHSDASVLVFMDGARPDATRAARYKRKNVMYCAAPIDVQDSEEMAPTTNIQYWAIGKDCCNGDFTCDDAAKSEARTGLVRMRMEGDDLIGEGIMSNDEMNYYDKAVMMAVTTFDITSPKERLYVHFVQDVEKARAAYWTRAWWYWWKLQSLWFLVWMVAGTMYVIIGAGDPNDPDKHPENMKDGYTNVLAGINRYV